MPQTKSTTADSDCILKGRLEDSANLLREIAAQSQTQLAWKEIGATRAENFAPLLPPLLRGMLDRATQQDALVVFADFLAERFAELHQLQRKLRQRLIYGVIILSAAWLAICFQLYFIVPILIESFDTLQIPWTWWLRLLAQLRAWLWFWSWLIPFLVGSVAWYRLRHASRGMKPDALMAILLADRLRTAHREKNTLASSEYILGLSNVPVASQQSNKASIRARIIGQSYIACRQEQLADQTRLSRVYKLTVLPAIVLLLLGYVTINVLPLMWIVQRGLQRVVE